MVWVEVLVLIALLSSLLMLLETFRADPLRRGGRGPSRHQRRWTSGGLSLLMAGVLVAMRLEGDTGGAWAVVGTLVGLGAAAAFVGVFRAPTQR